MMKRIVAFLAVFIFMLIIMPTPLLNGYSVTVDTDSYLKQELNNPYAYEIVSNGAMGNLDFTVNKDTALTLNLSASKTAKGGVLTNYGKIIINMGKYETIDSYGNTVYKYYNIINYNTIKNYGQIILNGVLYNSDLSGWGTGVINNYSGAVFTINSDSKLSNDSGATINNQGTFKFYGKFEGSGTFNNTGTTEQTVELFKDGNKAGSYTTLEEALIAANLSSSTYEIHVCTDITFDCTPIPPYNTPPTYPLVSNITISGKKSDGSLSTITFANGNYNPSVNVILKDIKIACSPGYKVFSNNPFGLQGEVYLPAATYNTVTVSGSGASTDTLSCTTLKLNPNAEFTSNTITATNISLNSSASLKVPTATSSGSLSLASGSTLTADNVSAKNIALNGGTVTINKDGLLKVSGAVSGSGGTVVLPLPSEHEGVTSSMTFETGSSVGSTTKITAQPASGVTIPNDTKLILLRSAVSADRFGYSDPLQIFKQSTLDELTYLTLRDAPYPTTLTQAPVASITYGQSATLTVSAARTSTNGKVPGVITFYKGSTALASNLLATVDLTDGSASYTPTSAQFDSIGNNQFLAVYTDPDNIYATSTMVCTVTVNAKALSVTGADVSSKTYDGKTDAVLNSIILSGIVGSENVTATGLAAFTGPSVGSNKNVNLTSINLKGTAASHYIIPSTANDVPTESAIHKATPSLAISATPDADLAPGESIVIAVGITGAPDGESPGGSIVLKDGESMVATAELTADSVDFTWNSAAEGLHNITAEYSGDDCYTTVSISMNLDLSKRLQAPLTVAGIPASVTYGDSGFSLTAAGGSGSGALSYTVTSGSSVSVNNHGAVTINSAGTSQITVTKAGDVTYNEVSTAITIIVDKAVPTLSLPPLASSIYRTRTLAESVISSGSVSGAFGETLEGVFLWKDAETSVTEAGSFDAVFVPQSSNYYPIPLTISVGLKKAVPIISKAPSATKVDVGNLLSKSILNGGTAIGLDSVILTGTFTWENPDEKVTGAAKHHAVFTPNNTEDYETVVFDLLVAVNNRDSFTAVDEMNSGYIGNSDIQIYEHSVLVNLIGSTKVTPLQMAELAEYNKEKPIIFSSTDYSFTFDKGVLRPGITAYDFGVSLSYGPSPNTYAAKLAGDHLVLTADYSYSGGLPGKARIRFYAGTRYAGNPLYYYLYNPERNRLEYMQATTVRNDGYIEIVQQHCSTYILTAQRLNTLVEIPETGIGKQSSLSEIYQLLQLIFGCAI